MISGKTSVNGPGSLVHLGSLKCIHPAGRGYKILEGIKLVLYADCSSSRWVDYNIHVSQRFRAVLRKASIEAPCPPYLCKPWIENGDKYARWKKDNASNQTRENLFYWDCPLVWRKRTVNNIKMIWTMDITYEWNSCPISNSCNCKENLDK